jgi:hypothetical protein
MNGGLGALHGAFIPRRQLTGSDRGPGSSGDDMANEDGESSPPAAGPRRSRRSAVHWDRPSLGTDEPVAPVAGPFELAAALVEAVETSDVAEARRMLADHPHAARAWTQCTRLLHTAAAEGCEDMVRLLLDAGASLSELDDEGQTPLHVACANENVGAAGLLAARVPCWELLVEDRYKMTPLHLATESGLEDLVALLLHSLQALRKTPGADAEAILRLRRGTCEFLAQRHGYTGVLGLLHGEDSEPCEHCCTAEPCEHCGGAEGCGGCGTDCVGCERHLVEDHEPH